MSEAAELISKGTTQIRKRRKGNKAKLLFENALTLAESFDERSKAWEGLATYHRIHGDLSEAYESLLQAISFASDSHMRLGVVEREFAKYYIDVARSSDSEAARIKALKDAEESLRESYEDLTLHRVEIKMSPISLELELIATSSQYGVLLFLGGKRKDAIKRLKTVQRSLKHLLHSPLMSEDELMTHHTYKLTNDLRLSRMSVFYRWDLIVLILGGALEIGSGKAAREVFIILLGGNRLLTRTQSKKRQ